MTTNPSARLAVHGEIKRGHRSMEPKAPLTCGGEAPTARSEFFTAVHRIPHRRALLAGLMTLLLCGPGARGQTTAPTQPTPATTGSAQAQLQHFIDHVSAATGHYRQTTTSPDGAARPASAGSFAFARPGRFRWATESPYEQLVLADGQQVYQYDPDLAQVSVRALDDAIGASPAAILFGTGKLTDNFDVAELDPGERPSGESDASESAPLHWLRALPRAADAGFSRLDIGLRDNLPVQIELLDTFGQTTRITLTTLTPAASLPDATFRFTVPEGVDVVRM